MESQESYESKEKVNKYDSLSQSQHNSEIQSQSQIVIENTSNEQNQILNENFEQNLQESFNHLAKVTSLYLQKKQSILEESHNRLEVKFFN